MATTAIRNIGGRFLTLLDDDWELFSFSKVREADLKDPTFRRLFSIDKSTNK